MISQNLQIIHINNNVCEKRKRGPRSSEVEESDCLYGVLSRRP
jgi:hypothetical protein